MKKYQSINPNNSRIFIDYSKSVPVRFEYIRKTEIFKIVYFNLFLLFAWFNLLLLLIMFFIFGYNPGLILFTFFFGVPFVVSIFFVNNNKLLSLMPVIGKFNCLFPFWISKYRLIKNLDKRVFEIPLFKNIFLEYKATREFSKYLEKVEITEHNFKYETRGFYFIKRREKQDIYWKARFYFSHVPKLGKLEIWWR